MSEPRPNDIALIITSLWASDLVVHLPMPGHFRHTETEDGWHRTEHRTACGRLLSELEWRGGGGGRAEVRLERKDHSTLLPWRRAKLLGRLCTRCAATLDTPEEDGA